MYNHLKTGFLLAVILLFSPSTKGQEDSLQIEMNPNVIHADFGILGVSISYERTIHQWEKSHLNVRAGIGRVITFTGDEARNIFPSLQLITGNGWFHFEAGLGINIIRTDYYKEYEPLPLAQIELRIEPPGEGFVFRVGIGLENNIINTGFGWKF
ncbi:MAG: hypothetical protein JXB49_33345 [Bacteroidales bacterium]|nr:hypothetical protein [Bacteroidales bacterium]MBN2817456.1 hypothetical protein [Bacteroidales bacterium]